MYKKLLYLILFCLMLFLATAEAKADCAGSIRCVTLNGDGTCSTFVNSSRQCESATTSTQCADIEVSTCNNATQCTLGACNWDGSGGGSGGGGSTCPSECRAGSSCPTGFQGASGCGSCNSNQVCCKANSCSAGEPTAQSPGGAVEGIDCTRAWGWSCEATARNPNPISIAIHVNGQTSAHYLMDVVANQSHPGAAVACGTGANHGFVWNIPAQYKNGQPNTFHFLARNLGANGQNTWLQGSPRTITCSTATAPPTPGPSNPAPIGYHDSANCTSTYGWACDASNYGAALQIHFYSTHPNTGWTHIGSTTANQAREPGVAAACGGNANHGFTWAIPNLAWLRDGQPHQIHAYALDNPTNANNPLLGLSPKTITCAPPATCNTTAPTNLAITPLSATSARVNWTPGTGGASQRVQVGASQAEVLAGCNGSTGGTACVTNASVSSATNNYTVNNLQANTVYYWKILNFSSASCSTPSAVRADVSSCALSPTSLNMTVGDPLQQVTLNVNSSPEIDRVVFRSNSTAFTVNNGVTFADTTYPYRTDVRAVTAGSGAITARVFVDGVASAVCTAGTSGASSVGNPPVDSGDPDGPDIPGNPGSGGTTVVTDEPIVINDIPWWQTRDGDITANGNINSDVIAGDVLADDGAGGFPGVPVYTGTLSYAPGGLSSTNWQADTQTFTDRSYDYSYFEDAVPSDITFANPGTASLTSGGTAQSGYYWYKSSGSHTITGSNNLGNRKVVLFVNGDLTINGNITLNNGTGFFLAIASGDIRVNGTVTGTPSLEGLFFANDVFSTGAGNNPLHVRGSVAALGGITLTNQRDLDDDTPPAELFEYAPDLMINFPSILATKRTKWIETAP